MKTSLLVGLIFLLLSLTGLLYFFNGAISAFNQCTYYNPNKEDRNIAFFGKITQIKQEENWIISNLQLCDSELGNIAHVKIYTPKDSFYFDLGEKIIYKKTPAYHWNKREMSEFSSIITKDNPFAVKVEELKSEKEILDSFEKFENFNCAETEICKNRVEFFKTQGTAQINFLNNLKSKKIIPLLFDFITGKAIIYSQEFGQVDSKEDFDQLTKGLLL